MEGIGGAGKNTIGNVSNIFSISLGIYRDADNGNAVVLHNITAVMEPIMAIHYR